jgi:hypothetical protein
MDDDGMGWLPTYHPTYLPSSTQREVLPGQRLGGGCPDRPRAARRKGVRREGRGRDACLPSSRRSGYGGLLSCARSSSLLLVLERALMPLRPGGVHVVPLPRPGGVESASRKGFWCGGDLCGQEMVRGPAEGGLWMRIWKRSRLDGLSDLRTA